MPVIFAPLPQFSLCIVIAQKSWWQTRPEYIRNRYAWATISAVALYLASARELIQETFCRWARFPSVYKKNPTETRRTLWTAQVSRTKSWRNERQCQIFVRVQDSSLNAPYMISQSWRKTSRNNFGTTILQTRTVRSLYSRI